MKKILFKYWFVNFTIGFSLYVIYRITIAESEPAGESEFKKFIFILEILVNLGFSLLYLVAVWVSSLTFFLNLFANIRNNFYASLFTFLGISLLCIIYVLFIYSQLDYDTHNTLSNLIILAGFYFLATGLQFLMFRRKIERKER